MEEPQGINTININEKWPLHIYESNIKNLEIYERFALEGCESILDYAMIPYNQRAYQVGDLRYKNLRFIITEFKLLLTNLAGLISEKEMKEYNQFIEEISKVIDNRKLFIKESMNINKEVTDSKVTDFFKLTLDTYYSLKKQLFRTKELKDLLYVNTAKYD